MKNYLAKALINFNDMEEKTEMGTDTPRKIGDVFNCTKERYEYLKSKNAVMLVGIDEIKEEEILAIAEPTIVCMEKPKTTRKKSSKK